MANHVIAFQREDEKLSVWLDGRTVAQANHDEHGWAGIGLLESAMLDVADILGAKVIET